MNRCKDCKSWAPNCGPYELHEENHRECMNPKINELNTDDDGLGYVYSEGGCMTTGPNFGCIHWSAK